MNESLLQQIAAGNQAAVQACIEQFGGLVWSLARRMCGSPSDAEEAVQEVFVNIWENADRYDPSIASEATFIAMIARRRLIDRRRRQSRRPAPAPLSDQYVDDGGEQVGDTRDTSEEAGRALEAMEQLRPEQQQVLQLSIMHGRTYEQIAASTGMPVGTVKTHARRGLIRLREILRQSSSDSTVEVSP